MNKASLDKLVFIKTGNKGKDNLIDKWAERTGLPVFAPNKLNEKIIQAKYTPIFYGILNANARHISLCQKLSIPYFLIDNAIINRNKTEKYYRIHYNSFGFEFISPAIVEKERVKPCKENQVLVLPPSPARAVFEGKPFWLEQTYSELLLSGYSNIKVRQKTSLQSITLDDKFNMKVFSNKFSYLKRYISKVTSGGRESKKKVPLQLSEDIKKSDLIIAFNSSAVMCALKERVPFLGGSTCILGNVFSYSVQSLKNEDFYTVKNPQEIFDELKKIEFKTSELTTDTFENIALLYKNVD